MIRSALARRQADRLGEFRWRSREITRIEGFSDAVFAFAVTLLVVSLEVPRTFDELLELIHGFIAFALGFVILVIIWYNQYKFFRRYGLEDTLTISLNAILLFVVLFFVYPLKFLFTYLVRMLSGGGTTVHLPDGKLVAAIDPGRADILMLIYAGGYVAVFAILGLLTLHAYRLRDRLELTEAERFDTRTAIREHGIQVGIGLLSMLVAGLGGARMAGWSGLTYLLIAPAFTLHGIVSGRARRKRFERP